MPSRSGTGGQNLKGSRPAAAPSGPRASTRWGTRARGSAGAASARRTVFSRCASGCLGRRPNLLVHADPAEQTSVAGRALQKAVTTVWLVGCSSRCSYSRSSLRRSCSILATSAASSADFCAATADFLAYTRATTATTALTAATTMPPIAIQLSAPGPVASEMAAGRGRSWWAPHRPSWPRGVPVVVAEDPTDIAGQRRREAHGQGQWHPPPGRSPSSLRPQTILLREEPGSQSLADNRQCGIGDHRGIRWPPQTQDPHLAYIATPPQESM